MTIKTLKFSHQPFLRDFIDELQDTLPTDVSLSEDGILVQVCVFSEQDQEKLEYLKLTHFVQESV